MSGGLGHERTYELRSSGDDGKQAPLAHATSGMGEGSGEGRKAGSYLSPQSSPLSPQFAGRVEQPVNAWDGWRGS
jgi:hypothetical protein